MSIAEQRTESSPYLVSAGASYPAPFAVDVRTIPGETVLALHGELDISTQQQFAAALAGIDQNVARIVLDLSDLTFIDCANIGLIHDARLSAGLRGTFVELRSPHPDLRRVLELTGLAPNASSDGVQHRIVLPLPSRGGPHGPMASA